jgi:hypothetical protein
VKTTFYNRIDIINKITGSPAKSFAVLGAMKIGKTSLLHRIYNNPPPNTSYIFIDLDPVFSSARTYRAFRKYLESEIKRVFNKKKVFGRTPFKKKLSRLPDITRELSREDRKVVFVFDGVDKFIQFDQKKDYKILRLFRTMSRDNCCQFIFSGIEELYQLKRSIEGSLCDFYEEIMLKPLDKLEAIDLIIKPMESIEIYYKDKKDVGLILDYTGCHPNLIQFYCHRLVEKFKDNDTMRDPKIISREDIENLLDTAYEDYIVNEVYLFYTDISNMDRLILMLLAEEQSKSIKRLFSLNEIMELLTQQGIEIPLEDMHRHLSNLVLRFILQDMGMDKYSFAFPLFPVILKKRLDDDFKNLIIEEIKRGII